MESLRTHTISVSKVLYTLLLLLLLNDFILAQEKEHEVSLEEPPTREIVEETASTGGEDAASSALVFNNFDAGSNDLGVFQNSINLYTGEVALPMNIAALPAVRGLSANLSISYSSANVGFYRDTWNLEAPTGASGLGWSLDYPKIIVDNKQTGTREDDEFYLVDGGSSVQLVRTGGTSAVKEYETLDRQFWKIKYHTGAEKWEIIKDDGSKLIYGDQNSSRSTVQWDC